VIGPDGAGKTSTLRVVAGLQRPSDGSIEVLGGDAWRNGAPSTTWSATGPALRPLRRPHVDENIRFFARSTASATGAHAATRCSSASAWRRSATARGPPVRRHEAEARPRLQPDARARLLLLDEPTTGVDPVTPAEFWRLLADLVARA